MVKKLNGTIKILVVLSFLLVSAKSFSTSECDGMKACEKKSCDIKKQLLIANEEGNSRKADGLESALEEVLDHCTTEGLRKDLREDINDSQEDLAEYETDLQEAEKYGKTDKVLKYKEKIEDERNEIIRLEAELSNLE